MSTASSPSSGRDALERFAPAPAAALEQIERAAWSAQESGAPLELFDLAARVVAVQNGLAPLARPEALGPRPWPELRPTRWRQEADLDAPGRAAVAFAELMGFDVASLQDAERQALFQALGSAVPAFVQGIYVADLVPRVRAALDALFGASPSWELSSDAPAGGLQAAFDEWVRAVPQLQALDPVSTELVRLLGARRHRCRICQSLRSRSALVAGADESLFDAVDRHADSGLPEPQRALLAFADAMILPPGRVEAEVAQRVRAVQAPAACVELVLDVARNAANKVAVALAADEAHVESGVEIYDVGPDGELLYGLDAP